MVETLNVFVASRNHIKLEAVKQAVTRRYPRTNIEVTGIKCPSGVNTQPFGMEEIIHGAENRLQELIEKLKIKRIDLTSSILISIENGLVRPDRHNYWDIGVVLLQTNGEETQVNTTKHITVPKKYVKKAKARGFDRTKYGQIIAEDQRNPELASDPHTFLTNGQLSRQQTIEEAIAFLLEE